MHAYPFYRAKVVKYHACLAIYPLYKVHNTCMYLFTACQQYPIRDPSSHVLSWGMTS